MPVAGILDILDNYAFVRTTGYLPGSSDIYVPLQMVKRHGLRKGDDVETITIERAAELLADRRAAGPAKKKKAAKKTTAKKAPAKKATAKKTAAKKAADTVPAG